MHVKAPPALVCAVDLPADGSSNSNRHVRKGQSYYTDILEAIEKAGQLCEQSILASTLKTRQNTLQQSKNTALHSKNDINAMQNAAKQLKSGWICEYEQHFRV